MSETDIADFAFIVEQIFVGLLQNYTKDLLGVEATDGALYFKKNM